MKRKFTAKKPPLSALDGLIYGLLILSCFLAMIGWMFLFYYIPRRIAFSDPSVVACDYFWVYLSSLPLIICLTILPLILFCYGLRAKQPIFGNKRFKPKWSAPTLKVFPVFSREFRENMTATTRAKIRKTALILAVLLTVSVLLLPLGFFQREILDSDNRIRTYNVFNGITDICRAEDAEKLIIRINYSSGRKSSATWGIELKFVSDHKTHRFSMGSFSKMDNKETLEYMLYLKSLFGEGGYELDRVDRMAALIDYKNFTEEETALLYELFDYEKGENS